MVDEGLAKTYIFAPDVAGVQLPQQSLSRFVHPHLEHGGFLYDPRFSVRMVTFASGATAGRCVRGCRERGGDGWTVEVCGPGKHQGVKCSVAGV